MVLIILSSLIIFSYLFDFFARKTKFPSVPLLLLTGILIRLVADHLGWPAVNLLRILPAIGTVGLILIVLEASLELKYQRQKNRLILQAFLSAFVIMIVTTAAIAYIHNNLTGAPWRISIINAIPYSIISSAIAIPSSLHLHPQKREFIVYESTFSDILGIILFSFFLNNEMITSFSMLVVARDTFLILVFSILFCLLLIYLIGHLKHSVKFFLILSILILVYTLGHLLELPSLVIVLVFGVFLNNADNLNMLHFKKYFIYPSFNEDLRQLAQISSESAFLVRTFFFAIFGFIIDLRSIASWEVFNFGMIILITIYLVRGVYLRLTSQNSVLPELFVTPRGLISILLLMSIPEELQISQAGTSLLFLVVLASSLIMSFGLLTGNKTSREIRVQ
jgi:NhaP-type Na+/H+ or K+/H+ antiporter